VHIKLQTVIFDRRVSSLIQYLTNELSPENCEEERMPLVSLYVTAILHLLSFALRVLCGQGIAAVEYFALRVLCGHRIAAVEYFALRVLCGQAIAAVEYFGPDLSF
jgi:hypothetical protein